MELGSDRVTGKLSLLATLVTVAIIGTAILLARLAFVAVRRDT